MPKPGTIIPWTPADIESMKNIIEAAPTAREGIQMAAEKLGRSPGSTQQKYYGLKRANRPKQQKRTVAASKPQRSINVRRGKPATNGDLATMSSTELASLAQSLKQEIDRRRESLDAAAAVFS